LNITPKERLRQIFETTIDSGILYNGHINEIDYYSLLCKSTSNNQLYKVLSCNLSMFNYQYENEDSVLIIFSIPSSLNVDKVPNQENKHISERIMDILQLVEECFITVDYMDLKTIKEDKFVYMTIVKKIKEEEE
jgi:hypothetical protein